MLESSAEDGGAPDECEIVVRGKDTGSIRIGQRYGCDRGQRSAPPRAAECFIWNALYTVTGTTRRRIAVSSVPIAIISLLPQNWPQKKPRPSKAMIRKR